MPRRVVEYVGSWIWFRGSPEASPLRDFLDSFLQTFLGHQESWALIDRTVPGSVARDQAYKGVFDESALKLLLSLAEVRRLLGFHVRTHRHQVNAMSDGHCMSLYVRPDDVHFDFTFPLGWFADESHRGQFVSLIRSIASVSPLAYGAANRARWGLEETRMDRLHADAWAKFGIPVVNEPHGPLTILRSPNPVHGSVLGAFWLNILNPVHMNRAGGLERIVSEVRPHSVEMLPDGCAMVIATRSPIVEDTEDNRGTFLRLWKVLKDAF